MTQQSDKSITATASDLEKEHDALLKKALARPGVRKIIQIYGTWLEKDRHLNTYRAAKTDARKTTTSASSHA